MNCKKIKISLNDKLYWVTPRMSVDAYIDTHEYINRTEDHRACIVFLLHRIMKTESTKNWQPLPTQDEISYVTDKDLIRLVRAILKYDSNLNNYYKKQPRNNAVYCKFCNSLVSQVKDFAYNIAKSLQPFVESINQLSVTWATNIQESAKAINDTLSHIQTQISLWISKTVNMMAPLYDGTVVESGTNSFRIWAQYGWTMIQYAPLNLFFTSPNSQQEADEIAFQYIDIDNFSFDSELPDLCIWGKNNDKFNEVIGCFCHEYYQACALLIVSMIEEQVICYQKQNEGLSGLLVGRRATNKLEELTINNNNIKKKEVTYLAYLNTISFMKKLFEGGNNFIVEPDFINRNFLMHGMSKRKVSRRDCIKLLLALQNFIWLYNESK